MNSKTRIGYGLVLSWSKKLQAVVVRSRLVESPAGRHGVEGRMIVRSINGTSLDTEESFKVFAGSSPPIFGQAEAFVFQGKHGLHEVTMRPDIVASDIPVYWDPDSEEFPYESDQTKDNLLFCRQVGEYYTESTLKRSAVVDAFFGA